MLKQRTKKTFLTACFLGVILALLTQCRWNSQPSPSIIIIAVDQLGVNQINCNPETESTAHSGLGILCQEAIRFTHAYTTSPLSGPALTSILTGLYPFQHGLRSNSKSFLSGRVTTLAEAAQQNGFVTSFFSGGAPVLRKLNLQQGFETFDDLFNPTPNLLFRSFLKSQESFKSWLKESNPHHFLSVFYVPDLAYMNTVTQSDLGQTRNLSFESQLEEFDESLFTFIQDLKSAKLWDSTTLVVVGLNGPDHNQRTGELPNTNLFSERTQVGLLIKPAKKPSDQVQNWTHDENVNLADLGQTFLEAFKPAESDPDFPVISLTPVLKSQANEKGTDNRVLLIETAWQELPAVRYSIRQGQYLYLHDEQPKIFNSFIDRLETTPQKATESVLRPTWEILQKIFEKKQWAAWPELSVETYLKWKGFAEIWLPDKASGQKPSFERLAHRLNNDLEITHFYSRELLLQQNWDALARWASGMKNKDLEKIALKNLKKDVKRSFTDPCLAYLEKTKPNSNDIKKCVDPVALSLLEWHNSEKNENNDNAAKESARRKFLRQYLLYRLDQKIVETNQLLQGPWDLSEDIKRRPLTVEMMLALPEMGKFRQAALKTYQQSLQE